MNRADYLKHKDLIEAWSQGAEIEFRYSPEYPWRIDEHPTFDESVEYRIKPAEPEFTYPMWFQSNDLSTIVKFTALQTGEVVDKGQGPWKAGHITASWCPHTRLDCWTQIPEPKPKKTIVLEAMIEIGSKWQHKATENIYEVTNEPCVQYKDQQGEIYVRTEKHFLDSFRPAEPEFTYPMWFKSVCDDLVVRFDSLTSGEVIIPNRTYKLEQYFIKWIPHTDVSWTQIEEPEPKKKTIVLETWLLKNEDEFYTTEATQGTFETPHYKRTKVKLLSTRTIEL